MRFKNKFIWILMIVITISMVGCKAQSSDNTNTTTNVGNEDKIKVSVSIVPEKTFVKAVAGDLVDVITMIPPGNSPANYQPTPKQMAEFSESKIYFSIGVPTETANILPKVKDLNKDIKIVALDNEVGKVYKHRTFESGKGNGNKDPHIWLSPKRVKVMIEAIRDELILLDSDNEDIYEKNAAEYIGNLDEADDDIKNILSNFKGQSFIIYHPSFGYFADDYGLKMVSIEDKGKKATASKLQEVIDFAKNKDIKFIFYQQEFDNQQAETIAKEIGGKVIKAAPLDPNYIDNLRHIAGRFKEALK